MIRRENPNFKASLYAPNPKEVTYWIDLKEGPDGQLIKTFVNNKWVKVNEDRNQEQDTDIDTLFKTKIDKVNVIGDGVAITNATISGTTINFNKDYELPIANNDTIGCVKSSTTGTTVGRDYLVEVNADGTMKVNVPWVDTNTTYTEATSSVSGLMSSTDKSKLDGIEANANNYVLPSASTSAIGGVMKGTAVENLTGTEDAATICTKINSLLASLRTAGILNS